MEVARFLILGRVSQLDGVSWRTETHGPTGMFNSYAFLENTWKRDSYGSSRILIFLINTHVAIFIYFLWFIFPFCSTSLPLIIALR